MKKLIYLAMLILMVGCLSGCAYQRYHARNFKAVNKKEYGCRTWSDNHSVKKTMRYYYNQR